MVASVAVVAAACSSDDDDGGSDDAASATTEAGGSGDESDTGSDSDDGTSATTDAGDEGDSGTADDGDDAPSGDGDVSCASLFSEAEIEEIFFGEANQLLEDDNTDLGLLTCTWETTDEAEDDFAFIVMTAQVFTGDPIPAADFYDPSLFDDSTPVDGVGDDAFYSEFGGFYFLEGDVGGALSLTEVDVTSPDDINRPVEDVEVLFRTFAERVAAVS